MQPLPRRALVAAFLLALAPVPALVAQQPVRRWERPGFDFRTNGVWRPRARGVRQRRDAALARRDVEALNGPMRAAGPLRMAGAAGLVAPTAFAISGVLREPVFLARYTNSPDTTLLYTRQMYDDLLFSTTPPAGRPFTVRTFYEEMSNGLLSVQGQVVGWIALDSNDTFYQGAPSGGQPCNGLCGNSRVAQFLREALQKSDGALDFGQFDNDGPDGVANSPDDDGFVDLATFIHPEIGGECDPSNENVWAHRFALSGWGGGSFLTNDPRKDAGGTPIPGQFIRVDDYTIQSGVGGATSCDGGAIMPVGTIAHETGHGLGLPDLYDTWPFDADDSEGIGNWGLMSSGNYTSPFSPSHMEGFSRLELGWVMLRDLTVNGTYTLGAYAAADTIFRVTPPGANPRNEYFLIENRQGALGDSALIRSKGPGLLIYHVDRMQYNGGLGINRVNSGAIHGVWLIQADAANQLRSSTPGVRNRGDAGDPYPGDSANTAFGLGTNPPAALNSDGSFAGFDIDSIRELAPGGAMSFRLRFPAPLTALDTALHAGVMGTAYTDTVRVTGGVGAYSYVLVSGSGTLPSGLSIGAANGIITGIPANDSTWSFVVRASAGAQTVDLPLRIVVTAPQLAVLSIVDQLLLGGARLTADEIRYLDLLGNNNASLDVGDVLAWLDDTGTPLPAALRARLFGRPRR